MANSREQEEWESACREARLDEQKQKKDYDYLPDGTIDICDDCKTPINSHGHCPRCDY